MRNGKSALLHSSIPPLLHSSIPPLALFTILAIAWTSPLALHLSNRIPHDPGDPILNTWILWWNAQALPFTREWWDAPFLYPLHGALALSEHLAGIGLIATPLHMHFEIAQAALDAGKHVFVEKTMMYSMKQCEQIVAATKAHPSQVFQVGYQHRFDPVIRKVVEMSRDGALGKVTHIRCMWHRNGDWRRPVPKVAFDHDRPARRGVALRGAPGHPLAHSSLRIALNDARVIGIHTMHQHLYFSIAQVDATAKIRPDANDSVDFP